MKKLVVLTIVRLLGSSILLAGLAGIVIVIIGATKEWNTSLPYSNAFFIAGSLMIIAGGSSRLGAGQEWQASQKLHAESYRDLSGVDQANFIVSASASFRPVILGFVSGILLIIISFVLPKFFQPA